MTRWIDEKDISTDHARVRNRDLGIEEEQENDLNTNAVCEWDDKGRLRLSKAEQLCWLSRHQSEVWYIVGVWVYKSKRTGVSKMMKSLNQEREELYKFDGRPV